jgi:hypothetical protein
MEIPPPYISFLKNTPHHADGLEAANRERRTSVLDLALAVTSYMEEIETHYSECMTWLEERLDSRRPRLWATYILKHIHDRSWLAVDPLPFRSWRGYVLDLSAARVERRTGGRYVEGSVPAIDALHKGVPCDDVGWDICHLCDRQEDAWKAVQEQRWLEGRMVYLSKTVAEQFIEEWTSFSEGGASAEPCTWTPPTETLTPTKPKDGETPRQLLDTWIKTQFPILRFHSWCHCMSRCKNPYDDLVLNAYPIMKNFRENAAIARKNLEAILELL